MADEPYCLGRSGVSETNNNSYPHPAYGDIDRKERDVSGKRRSYISGTDGIARNGWGWTYEKERSGSQAASEAYLFQVVFR
jgi:hypothetical protein